MNAKLIDIFQVGTQIDGGSPPLEFAGTDIAMTAHACDSKLHEAEIVTAHPGNRGRYNSMSTVCPSTRWRDVIEKLASYQVFMHMIEKIRDDTRCIEKPRDTAMPTFIAMRRHARHHEFGLHLLECV